MKILVVGGGGREHALVWRLAHDGDRHDLIAAPGNPGISTLARTADVDPHRPDEVLALAEREGVDLTVVGPEAPLEQGLANVFRDRGRPIVGPSRLGAALETSKVHAKYFMARHRIPSATFVVAETVDAAVAAVSGPDFGFPVVVKAEGLTGGKGVIIAADRTEAEAAVRKLMVERRFGAAGARLVIEECLIGPEVSFFALLDGRRAIALGTAQDHKRIWDNDQGPNTGGMGAFAPSPIFGDEDESWVMDHVVAPVLEGMAAEGEPYQGFLYVSLMLTSRGPQVIEFNVRFGDPEAQVVLPLLEGPFGQTLFEAATGSLTGKRLRVSTNRAVGVVMASEGYPESGPTGRAIRGVEAASALGAHVFHSGTRLADGSLVTAGGRVLTVTGVAPSYDGAMATAYEAVAKINFEGHQYRRDIGRKAIGAAEVR